MSFSIGLWSDGPNTSEVNFQQGGRITTNYTRTYLYKTDAGTRPTDAAIVADLAIVPGSPHPDDANATCYRVEIGPGPERTRQPHLAYLVKVDWSTLAPVPNTVSTDPTTMRTLWSLSATIQQRYIVRDRNGVMILNSAGQPFDGGIPVAVRLGTAVAKKNFTAAGYDKSLVLAKSGQLNSVTYLGALPGTLQVDLSASERYEGGYHYWEQVANFAYDPLGWQPKPMNAGFFQRSSDSYCNGLSRIINSDLDDGCSGDVRDPTGLVQEPEPLLPNGFIVPIADRPTLCNFVTVDAYASFDFTTLGL